MERRWVIVVIVLLALAASGPAAISVSQARADDVAVLDPMQGMVQVRAYGGGPDEWVTLDAPRMVEAKTVIRTDSRGLATLVFFEGTEVEVLPNSIVAVDDLDIAQVETDGSYVITLGVLVGDTLHRVAAAADAESRYTVHTPSATIVVRGTEFWTSTYPKGETQVWVIDGTVDAAVLASNGLPGASVAVPAGWMVFAFPNGEMTDTLPITELPEYPPDAPFAPVTCGNGICEVAESEGDTCPLDCQFYSDCGDGICDLIEGENATVCPADCLQEPLIPSIPDLPSMGDPDTPPVTFDPDIPLLHFVWPEGACRWESANTVVTGSLRLMWGVGCFDSQVHALMHPYLADYQLTIDGAPADMSALRQTGPILSPPYCPWGWTFELGPLTLSPGEHTLRLVETITDTWSTLDGGGRNAGEVVEMSCTVTVN